jgi:hypothetical protein
MLLANETQRRRRDKEAGGLKHRLSTIFPDEFSGNLFRSRAYARTAFAF